MSRKMFRAVGRGIAFIFGSSVLTFNTCNTICTGVFPPPLRRPLGTRTHTCWLICPRRPNAPPSGMMSGRLAGGPGKVGSRRNDANSRTATPDQPHETYYRLKHTDKKRVILKSRVQNINSRNVSGKCTV